MVDDAHDFSVACLSRAARKSPGQACMPGRHRQKPRVESNLLRVPVPDPSDIEETLRARASVAAAHRVSAEVGRADRPPCEAADAGGHEHKRNGMDNSWNALLMRVLRKHGSAVIKELGPKTVLEPLALDTAVKRSFLQACQERAHGLTVSYHGTKSRNLPSIASRGLLVPGKSSGIKVANGSRDGLGIYTARLGAASLSLGFSDSRQVLVCAVCDTSRGTTNEVADDWRPSATSVQADFPQSPPAARVVHARDAVVVFESKLVAPLFLAERTGREATDDPRGEWKHHVFDHLEADWGPPQQVGRRRIVEPEAGENLVKFGGKDKEGHRVWLTPMPLEAVTRLQRRLQRRRQCIGWQKPRRAERRRVAFWPDSKWDV